MYLDRIKQQNLIDREIWRERVTCKPTTLRAYGVIGHVESSKARCDSREVNKSNFRSLNTVYDGCFRTTISLMLIISKISNHSSSLLESLTNLIFIKFVLSIGI